MHIAIRELAQRVDAKRRQEGLTQDAVARRIGLTQSQYSRVSRAICEPRDGVVARMQEWLEEGQPPAPSKDEILKLAAQVDALRREVRTLLGLSGRGIEDDTSKRP